MQVPICSFEELVERTSVLDDVAPASLIRDLTSTTHFDLANLNITLSHKLLLFAIHRTTSCPTFAVGPKLFARRRVLSHSTGPETVAGSSVCGAYQTYFTEEIESSTPRSKDGTYLKTRTDLLPQSSLSCLLGVNDGWRRM